MGETNEKELLEAIKIFKDKYGIKEPLDMFRLDEIIEEMRSKQTSKKKGRTK